MVAPSAEDLLAGSDETIHGFFAIGKGVKRFGFMSSSRIEMGAPRHGKVHEYIVQKGVGYGVLRPTWFMGRFSISLFHAFSIFFLCLCSKMLFYLRA